MLERDVSRQMRKSLDASFRSFPTLRFPHTRSLSVLEPVTLEIGDVELTDGRATEFDALSDWNVSASKLAR